MFRLLRASGMLMLAWSTITCPRLFASSVSKVEPPSWWAAHPPNPVRILVTGRDLAPHVTSRSRWLAPGRVKVSADRRYAFFDVAIASEAKPGKYALDMAGATIPFEILEPLDRAGRFAGFSPEDVLYLILPDRYANGDPSNDGPLTDRRNPRMYHGGDFRGIIQRLPYLKDLGVTTLWITPIYDNSNRIRESSRGQTASYHGYGAVDFYAVEEHFGDLASFRELVDAAHASGLRVMQDQVANHVGAEHAWIDAPPTRTWFHGSATSHLSGSSEMWTLIDPHASAGLSRPTLEGWFANSLPDLNQDDPEVERYLIQNTLWWIGISGIDAIRQDTVPYVPKRFWQKWIRAIKRQYPQFDVVGEVYSRDPMVVSHFEDAGLRLFDFPLQEVLTNVFIDGEDLRDIPAALIHDRMYVDANRLVTFLGLHDMRRFREKSSHDALKSAFQFLLTSRGTPLIYYGDEIGLRGGEDPDNRRDFPGGWPGDARNAFEASGRTPEEQDLFKHVRTLLRLRAQNRALRHGRLINLLANDASYVYARHMAGEPVAIIALGKAARVELSRVPWMPVTLPINDAIGSTAVLRRDSNSIDITGPGVFVIRSKSEPKAKSLVH